MDWFGCLDECCDYFKNFYGLVINVYCFIVDSFECVVIFDVEIIEFCCEYFCDGVM